jgi:hypothetical protein
VSPLCRLTIMRHAGNAPSTTVRDAAIVRYETSPAGIPAGLVCSSAYPMQQTVNSAGPPSPVV